MKTQSSTSLLRGFMLLIRHVLLITGLAVGYSSAFAQDGAAILDLLVRKGLITETDAQALIEEARQAPQPIPAAQPVAQTPAPADPVPVVDKTEAKFVTPTAKGWPLQKLSFSGRLQAQFAHLQGDLDSTDEDPATINHFFLRRMYFGTKAEITDDFTGVVTYDFVTGRFDAGYIEWKANQDLAFRFGLTKVPFAYEEHLTSSGSLKAIERSAVTRYFVEPNNGRRLGAGVYRNGIFLNGSKNNWVYRLAVTNPERTGLASSIGDRTNNSVAPWGFLGYRAPTENGYVLAGLELGFLPDQGGGTLGTGDDLTVAGALFAMNFEDFDLATEVLWSNNEHGAANGSDSNSWGFFLQPSYRFSDLFEGVFRFSYLDTDGRGVRISDIVRSGPNPGSSGTMNKAYESFLGGNWYIVGNNLKFQAGLVYGKTEDRLDGSPGKADAYGIRSMIQLQY